MGKERAKCHKTGRMEGEKEARRKVKQEGERRRRKEYKGETLSDRT